MAHVNMALITANHTLKSRFNINSVTQWQLQFSKAKELPERCVSFEKKYIHTGCTVLTSKRQSIHSLIKIHSQVTCILSKITH